MGIKYKIYLALWAIVCMLHVAFLWKYDRMIFAVGSEWAVYTLVAILIIIRGTDNEKSKN